MTGKVLRFKTPEKTLSGVQFLRIEDDAETAAFSLLQGPLTFRFTVDVNGCIGEEGDAYIFNESLSESYPRNSFSNAEEATLVQAVTEAHPVAREQILMWRGCSAGEKLQLQVMWTEDVVEWLLRIIRADILRTPPPIESIQHRLNELELLNGRIDGLRSALSYL